MTSVRCLYWKLLILHWDKIAIILYLMFRKLFPLTLRFWYNFIKLNTEAYLSTLPRSRIYWPNNQINETFRLFTGSKMTLFFIKRVYFEFCKDFIIPTVFSKLANWLIRNQLFQFFNERISKLGTHGLFLVAWSRVPTSQMNLIEK